jgi:hypothetical protein
MLTDKQIWELAGPCWKSPQEFTVLAFARAIEQASRRTALEEAFEPIKLAIGMLSLHGHEADAKKVAASIRSLANEDAARTGDSE